MGKLRNEQRALRLRKLGDLLESINSVVMIVLQDRVAEALHGIILEHQVAGNNHADLTLAPSLVEVRVLFRRESTFVLLRPWSVASYDRD